jgi:C2 domain/MUN domain
VPGVAAPKPVNRSSAMDLLKDFSGAGGQTHKSNKFPHGFMDALEKRVGGVLTGRETLPEFNNDPLIKRTFGAFLNEFLNPLKRKNLERDRKMEDLLLIFFPQAVKELQKGKAPDEDSWKWMSERHLAMFIRLISAILRDNNDWARERPELANRLQTLEKKLLMHDMDLTANSQNGSTGRTIEVEVPLSYEVKDMPLVLAMSRIYGISYGQVQEDINQHKSQWTEEAALKDLKTYQQCISLKTKNTINFEDFDTESAYESWKKNEIHEVSQMLFAIMSIKPDLAKTSTGTTLPQLQGISSPNESTFAEISRTLAENSDAMNSFSMDHDFSALNLKDDPVHDGVEVAFTFIPPDQRLYYKAVVKETLLHDIREQDPTENTGDAPLLSKKSTELLAEVASRWRVPKFSRRILLLDAIRELYEDRDIGLDTLDKGFTYFKEMPDDKKKSNRKSNGAAQELVSDWTMWTLKDLTMYQQCLAAIHDIILRDLFQVLQGVYGPKSPSFGMFMYFLSTHLYEDDLFPKSGDDLDKFGERLSKSFEGRASETYHELLEKHIPKGEEQWEFFHVIQLGKSVVTLCDKIQKRFKKTPSFFGASPLMILVKKVLPNMAEDVQHLVNKIMENAKKADKEIEIQDGFDLYREFVEIRSVYKSVLPGEKFAFHVEDNLQEFVWRWLHNTEENIPVWVEGAVKQDQFQMMVPPGAAAEEQRYSVSVFDVFRSLRESKAQLTELNWNDEYQHAKFMTRVAKAIGLGIAKYCSLVEQRFTREMDRLTPEQEAAMNRSQQEKWMQIAKNAISGTDKVEPFNFFPESLVKLNNVEYAMQNLDKLEQDMQVEDCAKIIRDKEEKDKRELERKQGPQPRRVPKMEQYVFTIKIIEAEDLQACDINGLSDPYVVLGNEFEKRLAKTRIIYGNLNPRWDETVDIITTGPLNIVATIWDWDRLGDHDCVGRTSLKLDPSLFRDFMPREFWLDLDTQGRLLLRVSMEGERDDIQFYFGKAFRALKRTERDMTRSITDKVSWILCDVR